MPVRPSRRLAFALCSAIAVVTSWSTRGDAYDKRACIAASDEGQGLRLDGKLLEAKERLLACADATCPSIVRAACAGWLVDLEKRIPSVTLTARDEAGKDVLGVAVTVDEKPLPDATSGRPIALDPGTHTLRFAAPGGAIVERVVVLAEGEQGRIVDAVFHAAAPPPGAVPVVLSLPPVGPVPARSTTPWAAWGFTIGAAAALATFGGFALDGHLAFESAASSCNGRCPPDRYDSINTRFIVADVSLGVAIAAAGVATVLFLTHKPGGSAPTVGGLEPPP